MFHPYGHVLKGSIRMGFCDHSDCNGLYYDEKMLSYVLYNLLFSKLVDK